MSVDSATSPLASRRMTGGGSLDVKMEGFGIRGTNQKGVWGYGYGFLLIPGTLFFLDSSVEY